MIRSVRTHLQDCPAPAGARAVERSVIVLGVADSESATGTVVAELVGLGTTTLGGDAAAVAMRVFTAADTTVPEAVLAALLRTRPEALAATISPQDSLDVPICDASAHRVQNRDIPLRDEVIVAVRLVAHLTFPDVLTLPTSGARR